MSGTLVLSACIAALEATSGPASGRYKSTAHDALLLRAANIGLYCIG